MGLDVYLYSKVEYDADDSPEGVPSEKYPDHLFNRRYLRSSYNGSGFNAAVPNFLGEECGLYWIFEGLETDDYDIALTAASIPTLETAKERALSVAERLRNCDRLRSMAVSTGPIGEAAHLWSEPPSASDVLDWYRSEAASNRHLTDYLCAKGAVYRDGFTILAITTGRGWGTTPVPIIVYRADTETLDSYVQSAEITAEFCDEAISLIQRDGAAYISWSA